MVERADDARITALALAAGAGDRAALAEFVRATQRDVHRFVAHLAGPRDADDLAQETYLRALRSLPRFAGRSSARTWLLAVARHTAADAVRTAVRRPRTSGVENWDALAAAVPRAGLSRSALSRSASDEAVVLRELITALDPDRREAFVLTQLLGLSYGEAAEVCGCPTGTIRSRVARARDDLVQAMDADGVPRQAL
ncbi:sigma-70 family RNA polymerase sigma factor [Pseudonocardia sp. GCM10023141]|uniref:sigma-70 family RNA polymerase sigma factor n=1 Tax=Pseudonocardia sp. GCM10023141 TaxID=3252653 RepID=UPI00360CB9CB